MVTIHLHCVCFLFSDWLIHTLSTSLLSLLIVNILADYKDNRYFEDHINIFIVGENPYRKFPNLDGIIEACNSCVSPKGFE